MKELKKHQHYVWKEYLKPWTSSNKIFCRRKGKTFQTSLDNIAQERFFYKSLKIGDLEMQFIQSIIKSMIPKVANSLTKILELYNDIANSNSEYLIKCGIEDLHTTIENYGDYSLKKIQKGEVEFLKEDKYKHELSLFLGVQYTRTKGMREKLGSVELQNKNIDLDNLSVIMPFIMGEFINKWIYHKGEIQLLKNNTVLNFISSDQPIFNIKSPLNRTEESSSTGLYSIPLEFELYYPVSPRLAIYINKTGEKKIIQNCDDVRFYNRLVKTHSFEQLFAKEESDFL